MNALIVVGAAAVLALVFLALYAVVWLAVRLSPRFERWLDERWVAEWRIWP